MNFARGKLRIGVLGAVTEVPSIFNEEVENEQIQGGHTGVSAVKEVQQALKTRHYDPGPIDGFWGPKTCSAMLQFQKAKFGTAKAKYLDYDTFMALGFDVQRADQYASKYGMACGGTVEPPSDYGPGTEPVVSVADVKKIQRALNAKVGGVKVDGVWGPTTCTKLFTAQKKVTGSNSNLLLAGTFKYLGFDSTTSMRYAQSFAQVCGPWHVPGDYVGVTPKQPTGGGGGTTPKTPADTVPVEPAKAGFGLWLAVGLGLTILGTALFAEGESGKRGSYIK